jgi:hypothetical protein
MSDPDTEAEMQENHSLDEFVTKTVLELTYVENADDIPPPIRAAAVFIHDMELGSYREIREAIVELRKQLRIVDTHAAQILAEIDHDDHHHV